MPFNSSPSLDNQDQDVSQPGTLIGGASPDAHREQQLHALQKAKEEEMALQKAQEAAEYREQISMEQRRLEKTRMDIESRELTKTYGCYAVSIFVLVSLLYLAFDAYRNR